MPQLKTWCSRISEFCSCSATKLCVTVCHPMDARLLCPPLSPGVCSNSQSPFLYDEDGWGGGLSFTMLLLRAYTCEALSLVLERAENRAGDTLLLLLRNIKKMCK